MQLIEVRGLDHGISIAGKISVARVVDEHKNYVGLFLLSPTGSKRLAIEASASWLAINPRTYAVKRDDHRS